MITFLEKFDEIFKNLRQDVKKKKINLKKFIHKNSKFELNYIRYKYFIAIKRTTNDKPYIQIEKISKITQF